MAVSVLRHRPLRRPPRRGRYRIPRSPRLDTLPLRALPLQPSDCPRDCSRHRIDDCLPDEGEVEDRCDGEPIALPDDDQTLRQQTLNAEAEEVPAALDRQRETDPF